MLSTCFIDLLGWIWGGILDRYLSMAVHKDCRQQKSQQLCDCDRKIYTSAIPSVFKRPMHETSISVKVGFIIVSSGFYLKIGAFVFVRVFF